MNQNFAFFTGVIEDINDPLKTGRVRARCFGYHSHLKSDVPTSSLPWATVLMPVTSASVSGVGTSPTGIKQGSWVIGFFRDASYQDPIILGVIPSISGMPNPDQNIGFKDPAMQFPIGAWKDGVPDPTYEPLNDIPKTAYDYTASPEANLKAQSIAGAGDFLGTPIPNIATPLYPYNLSHHSLAGHSIEIDDTPNSTRYSVMHKSGTYFEYQENGDAVEVVRGDQYSAVLGDGYIKVKGNVTVIVEGNADVDITGSATVDIGQAATVVSTGLMTVKGIAGTNIGDPASITNIVGSVVNLN